MDTRIERDSLGEMEVPAKGYWGIHTQRALANFSLTGTRVNARLIRALATVKKACCLANRELGYLDEKKSAAIAQGCDEIIAGALADQFPLEALQGGAGTSTNMNVNEVIANRALELLGRQKGDYASLHPIQDVNLHQSTNDVFPTALKIAAIEGVRSLSVSLEKLQGAFQRKEKEFAAVVKVGRTELQDAVPMTMGQEFSAFAEAVGRDRWRTFKCEERLRLVNLGGTAVGTGITAPQDYIFLVIEKARELTGMGLCRGENAVDQTANSDCFVEVSGILKASASTLAKIANDLRILNLLGEVSLPRVQAGSSIMPEKHNPVIAEAVIQAALKVMADDFLVAEAVSRASLQINEFLPLVAQSLLEAIDLLINAAEMFAGHVALLEAQPGRCREYFDNDLMIVTALVPQIGYEKAGVLLKEFAKTGRSDIRAFLEEKLGKEVVAEWLSPSRLSALGYKRARGEV